MEESSFKSEMLRTRIMRVLGDRLDYWTGYERGLRRLYHGKKFGTSEEHEKWLSLTADSVPARAERGEGYLDGLSGKGDKARGKRRSSILRRFPQLRRHWWN
jgi:hypothetical protein